MTDIEIKLLDAVDQAEVDGYHATTLASLDADVCDFPPHNLTEFTVGIARPVKTRRNEHFVAKVDGQVVGRAELRLQLVENKHLGSFELDVHPRFRRRGIGSALLARVERAAREDGRSTMLTFVANTIEGKPAVGHGGQIFAKRNGYAVKMHELRSTLDLDSVDQSEWDGMLEAAWAKAEGYELVQWVSTAPDDVIDGIAYLDGRLGIDAPMGGMSIEPQKVDAARLRDRHSQNQAMGNTSFSTVVRHRESGTIAGWSDMNVMPTEEHHCWQGITIVDPDHRGHRLGAIVKLENHRQLLRYRPLMRHVTTYNAETNNFMININEAMGYRARERWLAVEKDLSQ